MTKLVHFDLDRFFGFGAFGDDHIDRNELLPFALERCGPNGSARPTAHETIVVGDTPMDVRCAQVHGARALAVATGRYTWLDLHDCGADWVLEDLSDVSRVLALLTTSHS